MIKMIIKDVETKCNKHFDELSPFCKQKIEFIISFFQKIKKDENFNSDSFNEKLHGTNKKSIINYFIKDTNNKIEKVENLNKSVKNIIDSIYISNIDELIGFFSYLNNNLKKIFKAKNCEFQDLESDIFTHLKNIQKDSLKGVLTFIFNYDKFIEKVDIIKDPKYNAYSLSHSLSVNVCPYCNRLYTNTVINSNSELIRPTLDHFYDKATHPIFSLSFYNLIPSCSTCNSYLKGTTPFESSKNINPHDEGFDEDAKFFIECLDKAYPIEPKIKINNKIKGTPKGNKIDGNKEVFKLEEIYQFSHSNLVEEIHKKLTSYNPNFILDSLKSIGLNTKEEIYEFYFSNYYNTENFQNKPLSKFTKDIFDDFLANGYAQELKIL